MEMKVCFAINNLCSGGAERVMVSLANGFSTLPNVKVMTICFRMPYRYKHFFEFGNNVSLFLATDRNPSEIANILIEEKPDVLISFLNPMNYLASKASHIAGIPHIVCERNNPYFSPDNEAIRKLRDEAFAVAAGCVFQTENAYSYFKNKINGRFCIIPNAVTLDFNYEENTVKRNTIVTVARYADQKNYPLLLRSFKIFHDKYPDYRLECYGKDSGKLASIKSEAIRLGVENFVEFNHETLDVHIRILDAKIFVLLSDYEGMCNALSEAAALGLPCVCRDIPGVRELIEKYGFGILVEEKNEVEVADALERIIQDVELSKRLSHNGIEMYKERGIDTVIPLWYQFILEILNQ